MIRFRKVFLHNLPNLALKLRRAIIKCLLFFAACSDLVIFSLELIFCGLLFESSASTPFNQLNSESVTQDLLVTHSYISEEETLDK
jgi:hypothetical protein